MFSEFKKFALRGNVVDLGVAIIIGGAFSKIVTSFVLDILTPPLGIILGGVDFKNLKFVLQKANGTKLPVTFNYGSFMQAVIDFTFVAIAMFIIVKLMNASKKKVEIPLPEIEVPPGPTNQEKLLIEIRDLLRK